MGKILEVAVEVYDDIDWRKKNKHNYTHAKSSFYRDLVEVGNKTYGEIRAITNNKRTRLKIGSYCSIAKEVWFVVSGNHPINNLSTYPFRVYSFGEKNEIEYAEDMIIGDDVWIGANVTILPEVHIGQGAVIAAGAVVTKDVPPYAVVGGCPAKVIKYRFEKNIIDYLMTLDYEALTDELVKKHKNDFYLPIDNVNRKKIEDMFAWFPKKELDKSI